MSDSRDSKLVVRRPRSDRFARQYDWEEPFDGKSSVRAFTKFGVSHRNRLDTGKMVIALCVFVDRSFDKAVRGDGFGSNQPTD